MATEAYYRLFDFDNHTGIDLDRFEWDFHWNNEGDKMLLKFKKKPHGRMVTLNHKEAMALLRTPEWKSDK